MSPESSLSELFPESDYEFKLTLRRAEPHAFFARSDAAEAVLRERGRWLDETPARYCALQREAEPIVSEFAELAATWPEAARLHGEPLPNGGGRLDQIGRAYESDVLFLASDDSGMFRLHGGVLCFPTGWALEEKLGRTLEDIHGIVPGLNAAIGPAIQQFLAKLRPGMAYLRQNWGIAATDELNLHPARNLAAPTPPVRLDALWLRVEHQTLFALPRSRGIVFGIRIANHPLARVAASSVRNRLRRALASMPEDLAAYKRIAGIRAGLIDLLG